MTEKTPPQTTSPEAANAALWSAVKETDPRYTKDFSRAGGFKGTAIGATYLAMRATESFGPMGIGWGVDIDQEELMTGAPILVNGEKVADEIIHKVRVRLWYKYNGQRGEITQFGQTTFVGRNSNGIFTDEEAPKKSLTDGMSKCLSLLGFSADVHMGLYDDNKYIAELRTKYNEIEAHKRGEASVAEKARTKPMLARVRSGDLTREQAVAELEELDLSEIAYERALTKVDELLSRRAQQATQAPAGESAPDKTLSQEAPEASTASAEKPPAAETASAADPQPEPAKAAPESSSPTDAEKAMVKPVLAKVKAGKQTREQAEAMLKKMGLSELAYARALAKVDELLAKTAAQATSPAANQAATEKAATTSESATPSEAEKALVKPLLARVKAGQMPAAAAITELSKLDISAGARQRATNKINSLSQTVKH